MYKKLYISSLLAVTLIAGCKKDILNASDPSAYSSSSYPASVNDLQSVLAACYSNLRDPDLFGFHLLPKALSNSTHTANSAYNGDPAWNEMANTNLSVNNQYSTEAYTAFYTGVKNCNVTLAGADLYAPKASAADKVSIDYIRGQAYFLRAYYYFQLECLFGESYITATSGSDKMGVPIYNGLPTDLASTQVARSSTRAVWNLIESDLKQSATLLKGKVWTGNDVGRVSEWAAKGLLGKAYVFTQDWANAKTTLLDVIQNSGKTLMPFAKYADAFNGNSANEFNEESLFELNIDADAKGNDYGVYGGKAANATTINGLIWPAWALGADGTEGAASPLGYGNEIVHDKNIPRFGFNIGYYNLVPNPTYTGSNPSYNNPQQIMDPVYRAKALLVRANKTADPRLFVNTIEPWIDVVKPDGVTVYPASKPNFYAGQVNTYGFSFRKYAPNTYNENNNGPADGWNYYLLRMADVYLLYAETCAATSDNATALEYLNKVKRRAYSLPINTASATVDYKSLTDVTSATGDPVLGTNPLYYERWAELFNEGHWWYDVCRWKIGKSEATYFGTALNLTGAIQWDDNKSYTWPIPLSEINSNSKIKQNPGY
ncbi:RagB/SusD family nutrient uptake outer membrane protein [Mucilaginibacter sp.]|uniref:RagB/SusD family nutrient uptake outer membrane protein n=1 Tax=Mucilaginibacter sp. TaxID=1882438 RepID=UPI00261F0F27|nr:RagB/SusD family nutrient uptake outer membrane protein [Mucilaginibacter sp.]MDB4923539.1 outer membrane protein nutrient binding [Mucilaginibacter sp.]